MSQMHRKKGTYEIYLCSHSECPPALCQEVSLNLGNLSPQTKGLYSGVQRAEGVLEEVCCFSYLIQMLLLGEKKMACIQLCSCFQTLLQTLFG